MFDVGPFSLHAEIGGGGMGAVWGGVHREQGLPVAVKFLHARFADTPWFLEAFRNEVRSVARLRHPAIVTVFDHGEVDAAAARASGGAVEAGSPWLAMERVEGRPLARLIGRLDWPALRRTLLGLLDGLAHAHARGVVHRDIKPGNAMATQDRVVLVDFGLAHWQNRALDPEEMGQVVGTAAYMAPEQFHGDDASFGPWTDLYAVGCLAWALVTGQPPFGRRGTLTELQQAHLLQPLPALEPLVPVPPDLEAWLRVLLHKDAGRRFARAADAAWALKGLDSATPIAAGLLSTFDFSEASTWADDAPAAPPAPAAAPPRLVHPRPPLPARWQRPHEAARSIQLTGAGLRLFGLRSVPLVGREAERDRLWEALGEVVAGQTRAAVLHGRAGAGKSRLASWLCERAHELGQAEVLEVTHGEVAGPSDGLGAGLARWLRVAGLSDDARDARITRLVAAMEGDEADRRAALALTDPRGGGFPSAHARHAALHRLLARIAEDRPLIVRIEDVQWGADALSFAVYALSRAAAGGPPILFLGTCRELPPDTLAARLLDRLLGLPGARRVEVGPLPPGRRTRLIEELLHLEGDLADAVERRTAGNPLFIVQLVGDWVDRGVLVPGARGFQLRSGETADLPDDLHAVWQYRVTRALRGRSAIEVRAVKLAALLGMTVDRGEWTDACRAVGAHASNALVEDLFGAGLAEADPRGPQAGWSFVHGMLRESLVREAEAAGEADTLRRGCVAMLEERRGRDAGVALRLGRYRLALGDTERAVDLLSEGAWAAVRDSEYLAAEAALAEREAALTTLAPPPDDRRWAEGWIMRARVARRRDHPVEASSWTGRALTCARRAGFADLSCQALREQARLADWRGERRAAIRALTEALDRAREAHDALAAAWVCRDLGLARLDAGAPPEAVTPLLDAAAATFGGRGEVFGAGTCLLGRAIAARRIGRAAAARELLDAASATLRRSLDVQEPAHAWAGLARAAWERGDLAVAADRHQRARQRFDDIGHPGPAARPLHQARVELGIGRVEEAVARLEAREARLVDEARLGPLGEVRAVLALARAVGGRPRDALRAVEAAVADLEAAGEPSADLAEVADALRRRGARAGDPALVAAAARLGGLVAYRP